jgi:glycyl-tRNA synthetase beta chain
MRWGELETRFIRPIHSILTLAGKKIIPFEIAGIKASNKTFSHRYRKATNSQLLITKADLTMYKRNLFKLGVVVDHNERKELIRRQVETLAKKAGATAVIKDDLLTEVNFLVENPIAYLGEFNQAFLTVPQDVLITSMQKNQKYFPLIDSTNKLQAKFIVVTNGCPNSKVVEGNEKVLTARLSDARFFFEEDKKTTLSQKAPELAKVSFFEKLGNLQQKAERLARLAEWIGKRWGLDEAGLKACRRIAELCKVDLTTKMVFEFPELQGVMGREYALASGETPKVAEGIFEHYLPRSIDDKTPLTIEGSIVAVADRLDTVVGAFLTGYTPSGSEDPYGIRRAVIGVIRIILAGKFDLLLDETIDQACKSYETLLPAARESGKVKKCILEFIAGRLKPLLLEKEIRYDIVDAVLYNFNDILDVVEKSEALNSIIEAAWLKGVVASADRLSKIAGKAPREQVLEHDLIEPEEKELYELYLKNNWETMEYIKKEKWVEATSELAKLTTPIELFFDKILVMHEDERLKLNRLALLKSLEKLYLLVADFRKIVL